jgi:mono/diheme cytochrome c family protein
MDAVTSNRITIFYAVALSAMLISLTACGGETGTGGSQNPILQGEESFVTYCASCHGIGGRGDGPVAEALKSPPPDLTQLRGKYGGVFEVDSVYAYIDGSRDVQAHGTREMPVWGNIWVDERRTTMEDVDLRMRELVEYLRTLQVEPSDAS